MWAAAACPQVAAAVSYYYVMPHGKPDFTAIEGQNTGTFVLATYTDPNTLATVANENATLAVGGWGDGTPTVGGVTLVVQQIGVTPLSSTTDPGAPIFEVLGSHTYAEQTPAGTPDPLSVIITTLGGVTTTLTSPPGGGVSASVKKDDRLWLRFCWSAFHTSNRHPSAP